MLTVFFLAPSNHPEWVNIRLVSGEEKQMNTFEVKNQHQSYWCVDGRVLFKKKLTTRICMLTMPWHKVNGLKTLFQIDLQLQEVFQVAFMCFKISNCTEYENSRQKILLTNWTCLCPWLVIIIVGRWDSYNFVSFVYDVCAFTMHLHRSKNWTKDQNVKECERGWQSWSWSWTC